MADQGLMPIGAFAKQTGLTASALRFYDDAGVLRPEEVDPVTGYRFYGEAQVPAAERLRALRAIGMSLPAIRRFLTADADEATRLINEQTAKVSSDAAEVQRAALALKASLSQEPRLMVCTLPGPVLAEAIDQVLATAVHNPDLPALGGVRLEADAHSVTLTATDRYRLATRTLVPTRSSTASWAGTLAGDDLRAATSPSRRSATVTVEGGERTWGLHLADGTVRHWPLLTEAFPDHRLLIASLPPVTHRVTVEKQRLVKALERHAPERLALRIVDGVPTLLLSPDGEVAITGSATGTDDLTVWFELTTLYPALSHAIGGDLMLDLRGPDQPVTVRSADDGDLTALVMPRHEP